MRTMNVSLPEELEQFIEDQARTGGYADASAYLSELVRERRKSMAVDHLRSLIAEGMASGPLEPVTPEFWAERRRILEQRIQERRISEQGRDKIG